MDDRVREAQRICAQAAEQLLAVEDRLRRLMDELPESPDRERMEEGEIPPDVATDVIGALECVIGDDLQPAIKTLESAASATSASLEREWKARKKRR